VVLLSPPETAPKNNRRGLPMDNNPQAAIPEPTDQVEQIDTGFADFAAPAEPAQAVEEPAPASAPIDFAEPEAPCVKTLEQAVAELQASGSMPQPVKPQKAETTFIELGDGASITRNEDGTVSLRPANPPPEPAPAAPLSERALSRREAELEAGRRSVARHEEQMRRFPRPAPSATEVKAAGTNTPVFRPGNFREYAGSLAQIGTTPSKDSGRHTAQADAESLAKAGY
jgi:hypothetical protein